MCSSACISIVFKSFYVAVCATGHTGFHFTCTFNGYERGVVPLFGLLLVALTIYMTCHYSFRCVDLKLLTWAIITVFVVLLVVFMIYMTGCCSFRCVNL